MIGAKVRALTDTTAPESTQDTIVRCILWPCWRGISDDYKRKYARGIWQQFEDNIRSAAYTSELRRFVDALCRKLNISIRAEDAVGMNAGIASLDSRLSLTILRDETIVLVLMVRVRNEARREAAVLHGNTVPAAGDGTTAKTGESK